MMSLRDCTERERVGFSVPFLRTSGSCAVVSVSVRLLGKVRRRWVDNVKMDPKKELSLCIRCSQGREKWRASVVTVIKCRVSWNAVFFIWGTAGFWISILRHLICLHACVRECVLVYVCIYVCLCKDSLFLRFRYIVLISACNCWIQPHRPKSYEVCEWPSLRRLTFTREYSIRVSNC